MYFLTAKTCAKDLKNGEFSIFPTERTNAPSFSQTELLNLSDKYSQLYQNFIENISSQLSLHYNLQKSISDIFAREAVVPLIHFFMDRLLRLDRLMKEYDGMQIVVKYPGSVEIPNAIEHFEASCCSSYRFNQWILCNLSEIYGIQVVKGEEECREETRENLPYKFINYNYKQSYFIKAQRAFTIFSSWLFSCINHSNRGKYPALSMAYATPYLQAKGFFGSSSLGSVCGSVTFDIGPCDPVLRDKLLAPILEQASPFVDCFLDSVEFSEKANRDKIITVFKDYFLKMYPSVLFENITSNMAKCLAVLEKYKGRYILFSDVGNTESTYFFVAAKCLKMQIVDCQEGGHHGYEDDYAQALQSQYNYMDKFVSWGWTEFPYKGLKNKVETIPLPTPWLSSRKKYWSKITTNKKCNDSKTKYDFLLMPNKIWPYPPAPSGSNVSRIDHIKAFAELLKEFVGKAVLNGLTVLHKPYNEKTVDLLHYTMKELELLGGVHYHCDGNLSKGLRHEFLNQCTMVLWDQPGTGFLECLTSGLPTMILWPRIYNQETSCARTIFSELEDVGICHREVDSVLDEYLRLKGNVEQWMNEPKRVDVVKRFCRKYAWTEKDWQKYWRKFLKSLR